MKDNTMENIKTMILEDSHRWQCPNYNGVVVVHPDMIEDVVSMICVEFPEDVASLKVQRNIFTLKSGGELNVVHMESSSEIAMPAEMNH